MIHHPDVIRMRPRAALPPKQPPIKVLTDSAIARLEKLNAAARTVRACGLRILDQRLDGIAPLGSMPAIKIAAANRALLDQAGPPTTLERPSGVVVHVFVGGISVMWEVPQ